jgi:micrococcal nuclease
MMFEYTINITRVVDGDTVDGEIDLGFDVRTKKRIRLYGINAPESRTRNKAEKVLGLAAKKRLQELVAAADVVRLRSHGSGKYGRVLGELLIEKNESIEDGDINELYEDGEWISIATILIKESHGVPYFGGKRK